MMNVRSSPDPVAGSTDTPTASAERILRVAANEFVDRGFAEASMRHLAETAGIRPASLYHHFSSKEHLLVMVMRRGIQRVTIAFDDVTAERVGPRERLQLHIETHLNCLFDSDPFTRANITVFPLAPKAVIDETVPYRRAYERRWSDLLDELFSFDDRAASIRRSMLLGLLNSSLQWFDPNGGATVHELARYMSDLQWTTTQVDASTGKPK